MSWYAIAVIILFPAAIITFIIFLQKINQQSGIWWWLASMSMFITVTILAIISPEPEPRCPPNHAYIQGTCIPGVAPLR